jgi:predicted ATPase
LAADAFIYSLMVVDNVLQSIGDRGSKNTMIYLSSFMLSNKQVKNPNIYPYNVFRGKYIEPFVFSPITVFYGNNGSGKSTLLNIIANRLQLNGKEYATSNSFGIVDYCNAFSNECSYSLGEDDFGFVIKNLPGNSRYIKSEDILYEIKKIQQKQVLSDGMEYDYVQKGMTIQEAKDFLSSKEGRKQEEYIKFAQEKYSNGETSMQYFEEYLQPNALYLLDEPEVSLSPSNQVLLANEINKLARLLECQFVIATHSPFMLGTLNAKIYNIDTKEYDVVKWNELENVQYFYNFFKKHEQEFL